jgi:hypothetical protein
MPHGWIFQQDNHPKHFQGHPRLAWNKEIMNFEKAFAIP